MGAHSGHSHAVGAQVDRRMLWVALGINLAFFLAEVVAGIAAD